MGTLPKHLDVANTQFLLIGESHGAEPQEMEELEDEDAARMTHLGKDDSEAIYADLEAHAEDYHKLQTAFHTE